MVMMLVVVVVVMVVIYWILQQCPVQQCKVGLCLFCLSKLSSIFFDQFVWCHSKAEPEICNLFSILDSIQILNHLIWLWWNYIVSVVCKGKQSLTSTHTTIGVRNKSALIKQTTAKKWWLGTQQSMIIWHSCSHCMRNLSPINTFDLDQPCLTIVHFESNRILHDKQEKSYWFETN